jgi:hypothetical protein
MEVCNTKQRDEVLEVYRWSVGQAHLNHLEQVANWDGDSPWQNSLFRDLTTGKQWVVYLADQAWPGEVRLVSGSVVAT